MPHCSKCKYCESLFPASPKDYTYHCTYHDLWFSDRAPFAFVKVGCPEFVGGIKLKEADLPQETVKMEQPKGPWSTCEMCGGRFLGKDTHCSSCLEKMEAIIQRRKKEEKPKMKKPKLGQRKIQVKGE